MTHPTTVERLEFCDHLLFSEQIGMVPESRLAGNKRYVRHLVCVTGAPRLYSADELRLLARLSQHLAAAYQAKNWAQPKPPPPKAKPEHKKTPGLLALLQGQEPELRVDRSAQPLSPQPAPAVEYPWEDLVFVGRETKYAWFLRYGKQAEKARSIGEAVTHVYVHVFGLLKTGDWACTSELEARQVRATRIDENVRKCWFEERADSTMLSRIKLAAATLEELDAFIALYRQAHPHNLRPSQA